MNPKSGTISKQTRTTEHIADTNKLDRQGDYFKQGSTTTNHTGYNKIELSSVANHMKTKLNGGTTMCQLQSGADKNITQSRI
jgi:hypothetical protein